MLWEFEKPITLRTVLSLFGRAMIVCGALLAFSFRRDPIVGVFAGTVILVGFCLGALAQRAIAPRDDQEIRAWTWTIGSWFAGYGLLALLFPTIMMGTMRASRAMMVLGLAGWQLAAPLRQKWAAWPTIAVALGTFGFVGQGLAVFAEPRWLLLSLGSVLMLLAGVFLLATRGSEVILRYRGMRVSSP